MRISKTVVLVAIVAAAGLFANSRRISEPIQQTDDLRTEVKETVTDAKILRKELAFFNDALQAYQDSARIWRLRYWNCQVEVRRASW